MYSLGKKHYTNKVHHHAYERYYEDFLNKYRDKRFNFLEIGMDSGASMRLWKDYFKYAKIYGLVLSRTNLPQSSSLQHIFWKNSSISIFSSIQCVI